MSAAAPTVRAATLDLPPFVAAFTRRLHDAGVPVGPERAVRLARALVLAPPIARRRLYCTARAVLVSEPGQLRVFDAVFAEVFGARGAAIAGPDELPLAVDGGSANPPALRPPEPDRPPRPDARPPASALEPLGRAGRPPSGDDDDSEPEERPLPVVASDEEILRGKRFDALAPDELAALARLMARLRLAPPERRTRRARPHRRGERIDLRRTLRGSLRTAGDPIHLARRRRVIARRRLVVLCDISGSMEPYARAYLQFLVCAGAAGPRAEAFVFATRLTRVTRALRARSPERALEHAAAAAPDWSSGTRIADALRVFNDRHGRRGMARGAVLVILSDGWERGDPAGVGREMARLRRLAYRIVWVNPRAAASDFAPRAGGMAAALPHLDALVSGHSLDALGEVAEAIAARRSDGPGVSAAWATPSAGIADDEPWASATPVPGSSVAMPSGYGPSRGHTTPGWSLR